MRKKKISPPLIDFDAILDEYPIPKHVYIYFHSGWNFRSAFKQLEIWSNPNQRLDNYGIDQTTAEELIQEIQEIEIIKGSLDCSLLVFFTDHGDYGYTFNPDNPNTNNDLTKINHWHFPFKPTEEIPTKDTWSELILMAKTKPKEATALSVGMLKIQFSDLSHRQLAKKIMKVVPEFKSLTGLAGQISIFSRPNSEVFKKRNITRELALRWVKSIQKLIPETVEIETIIYGSAIVV